MELFTEQADPLYWRIAEKIVARQGGCAIGKAVVTTAGKLPAKYVVHTVGPVWNGGNNNEAKKLSECYKNSLQLAVDNHCKTIAFPNISTGIYRFPKREAAIIAVNTVMEFLQQADKIEAVYFVCFDEQNYELVSEKVQQRLE